MKIARFEHGGRIRFGVVEGEELRVISGSPFAGIKPGRARLPLAGVRLLAPVEPPDVLAIGLNYRDHADEGGRPYPPAPVVFLKAGPAVTGPSMPIVLPAMAPAEVDYEAELAIVIGRPCRHVSEKEALDYALGFTCGNDVSARDCQMRLDQQWARAKSFETFCPLGPWIETDMDPDAADISLRLNGQTMQASNTRNLIFSCRRLISYCSRIFTLRPGTVIMTGTPAGVGHARKPPVFLKPGDTVEVTIAGIGTLRNPVVAADARGDA